MMNEILQVDKLNKSRGDFKLKDISFALKEGCITGFIGINGAGKTTTIKSLLGLILKDAGDIKFFGKDFGQNESEIKNRIGVVLDDGYLYEDITINDMKNIIASSYSSWDEEIFKGYVNRFDLNPKQKISTLSKGMKMKYAISLALSHHADLLIMDEPTSGLDPLVRNELMDILLEFMQEDGKTVFFSTHITSDLDKVADVVLLIHEGEIILNEEKDLLLDRHSKVKGDTALLNENTRKLFISLEETPYGFVGITDKKKLIIETMKNLILEKPSIEDIMLAYVGRD